MTIPGEGDPCPGDGTPLWRACVNDPTHKPPPDGDDLIFSEGGLRDCPDCGAIQAETRTLDDGTVETREKIGRFLRDRGDKIAWVLLDKHAASHEFGIDREFIPMVDENGRPSGETWETGHNREDLAGNKIRLDTYRIVHAVLSIRPPEVGFTKDEFRRFREVAHALAVERGFEFFASVFHAYRCNQNADGSKAEDYDQWGPHMHIIGQARWTVAGPPTYAKPGPPTVDDPDAPFVHTREGWKRTDRERAVADGWFFRVLWTADLREGRHGRPNYWVVKGNWGADRKAKTRRFQAPPDLDDPSTHRRKCGCGPKNGFFYWLRRRAVYLLHHATYWRKVVERRLNVPETKREGRAVYDTIVIEPGTTSYSWAGPDSGLASLENYDDLQALLAAEKEAERCEVCQGRLITIPGLHESDWWAWHLIGARF